MIMDETAKPFRYFVLVADIPNRSGQYKVWHGCQDLKDALDMAEWYSEGASQPIAKVVEAIAVIHPSIDGLQTIQLKSNESADTEAFK
jgi:hypothetical protein